MLISTSYWRTGDAIPKISRSSFAQVIQSDIASDGFKLLNEQVNHFAEHSKIVMDALDEVSKIHPFIQGMCPTTYLS